MRLELPHSEIEAVYKEMILELFRHPLNKKIPKRYDVKRRGLNPSCGDEIEVMIAWEEGKLSDIGHQGQGCAISQAAASLITDYVKGKTATEILSITNTDMINMLGIPVSYTRIKCALLCLSTIQDALT
ncbi:MAG: SUF system FeS assembly protein, NifU family [Candidatus Magasanikbacteria bacterium GW2011_GWA2_56_11]|uniref:SUF system FeS assembly protein, NifU family n=1 Tax=Candidatus Magasanikbacteria bacterium GW2011_GWA2_56_11 TaxID=1619044 RepID=A0A0G2AMJ8_9BACT|nr:MAG: SUF system FeS assembly protein, NifU family [Candidatus Magasanikbacteria bacterium GW2011_GWA2_56_11]